MTSESDHMGSRPSLTPTCDDQCAATDHMIRLHGIVALRRDQQSPTGLAFALNDGDIQNPHHLPDCALELHVFEGAQSAAAFAEGVLHFGGQETAVHAEANLLLIARYDRPSKPGPTIDDCIELFVHKSASVDKAAKSRFAHEQRLIEDTRKAERKAELEAKWANVLQILRRHFDLDRRVGPDDCEIRSIEHDRLVLQGHFGTVDRLGVFESARKATCEIRRGSIGLTLAYDRPLNGNFHGELMLAYRADAIAAAVRRASLAHDADNRFPHSLLLDALDNELLPLLKRYAMLASDLAQFSVAMGRLSPLVQVARQRHVMATLKMMSDGYELTVPSRRSYPPPRLNTPRGGRNITGEAAIVLLSNGFIAHRSGDPTSPDRQVYVVTELGRLVATERFDEAHPLWEAFKKQGR